MSIHQLEQLSGRSIEWYWVWRGSNAVEGILAVRVGFELAAQIVLNLLIVLLLVQS